MNRRQALAAALVLSAVHAAAAAAAAPPLAACDAGHETLLQAAPPLADAFGAARAAWLDERRLRWGGGPRERGGYALVASHAAALQVALGEPLRGADAVLPLRPRADAPPDAAPRRFSHVPDGPTLELRVRDRARLAAALQGQALLVHTDAQGRVTAATGVQHAGALDALYAAAEGLDDLGATPGRSHTGFRIWAPTAQRVSLCLYRSGDAPAHRVLPLHRDARTGSWAVRVGADLSGHYYAFLVDVVVPRRGLVRNLVTDPYARSLAADSARAQVVDLGAPAFQPAGWDREPRPPVPAHAVDRVVYELHVRDFSAADESVPAPRRGKYLAFTEAGSRGMQHLQRLAQAGVTDVHLLPIFDLATVPERGCTTPRVPPDAAPDGEAQQSAVTSEAARDCFNWGYDPWHFTAPEGSYASDAADGALRVRELRAMVQALHRSGLRVGMDMVYNHTSASGQDPKSVLDRIVPGYYHRLDAAGAVERSTCCDNTATEHRMMAKLMIDSAVVWARDYRIDSMRFDLMGHQPRDAMERLQRAVNRAAGRRIDLIGEGWNFGEVADGRRFVQAAQGALNGSGIATFSDRARDAARGSRHDQGPDDAVREAGWLHGRGDARQAALVRVGLAGTLQRGPVQADYHGQPAGYASQPGEVVNYVENHDNQTLFDNNVLKLPPATPTAERARVQHLGNALVAFSQGIAYFHAGQEILRSKSLDRNSYDSGDWFNRLDWTLEDNGFGAGLPPARDNAAYWPVMRPLLAARASIAPTRAEIEWTRDAFLELLRIRASTTLLRLRSADDVARRLRFHGTDPQLVVGHLDGAGLDGAGFAELVYLLNASTQPQAVEIEPLRGRAFELHPAHRLPTGARHDAARGRFEVAPRSAVVFVRR